MRNLPAAYRQELARICVAQHYSEGEEVLPQGYITDKFFVVASGHVLFRRTDANQVWKPVGDAKPGQHFGLAMFTTQALSEYKVSALTDTTLYVMERHEFDKLVEAQPDILKAMNSIYLKRLELTHGFKWLTPGEDVVLTTHRHWFALVESLLAPIGIGLLFAALLAAAAFFGLLASLNLPPLLAAVPAVLIFGWIAYSINDYLDDDFIVTNKRVAHFERVFVKKELRNQIPNDKIQSISVRYAGPLASALKISDLEVRSAGRADSLILFDRVARAEKIRALILDQRGNLRAHDEAEMRKRFRARVEKDLTPYIYKTPTEEGQRDNYKTMPRRSWMQFLRGVWHQMFGGEFRDGTTITYRKHWVALARQAGRLLLLFVVLLIAFVIYFSVPILQVLPRAPTLAVFLFLFVVDGVGLIWQWEDWRNDIYQITDSQIVDIERLPFGLWSRSTEALLMNVQDARALRPSPVNSILNFGNVEVQTAGGGPPLVFYDVASPELIVEEIFRRMERHRLRVMEHQMTVLGQQVTDALITYDHMKEKQNALDAGPPGSIGVGAGASPGTSVPVGQEAQGEDQSFQPVEGTSVPAVKRDSSFQEFSSIDEGDDPG